MSLLKYFVLLAALFVSTSAWAAGGGWSIGTNLGFINSDQKDINKEIDALSATSGAKELGNAWEFNAHITYRMSGSLALSFRPSYFMYKDEDGTNAKYSLTGFTFFPMLKWYMLEDAAIKFYSQFGVGYGQLMGEIESGGGKVKFSGGDIGYMAGLGSEFCFFGGGHCVNIEGGVRFLSVDRFTADSASGTFAAPSRITQAQKDREVEINGGDLSATMSGVLGMVGYTLYF
jgi:hypothetical protein